ncbi:hypothetical protein V5097_14575 [Arenibacter palladensis]|uniref:fibronectin type III domain-containing protein n=1 Tax=Arenibacter palladensis TaxID=237373 RepID=UPI002FD31430
MKKTMLLYLAVLYLFASCSKSNEIPEDSHDHLPPTPFSISLEEINDKSATIVWTASEDPESKTIIYSIYLDDNLAEDKTKVLTYTWDGLSAETSYNVKIVASNGVFNTTSTFKFTTSEYNPLVFEGDVILHNQQEVIDFGKNRYDIIKGSLTIGRVDKITPSDIVNLSYLNDLTAVSGSIDIYRSPLKTLEGLNNIVSIGERLYINNNSSLLDLDALESLTTVTEYISLSRNPSLASLNGLNRLTQVEHVIIHDCDNLQNLNGLQNVNPVLNNLLIEKNDLLTDITALDQISSVQILFIDENASLQNINGLDNITGVETLLKITNNSNLTDLSALSKLSSVGEHANFFTEDNGVLINDNPQLETLNGLQSLSKIYGNLRIGNNKNLRNLKGLNNLAEVTGNIWLQWNDSLESLDDLENLISIHKDLRIVDNSSITNLDGLNTLESVGFNIHIADNSMLSSICGLQNVLNKENSPNISISGNAFDSNNLTKQDIIDGNCSN